jgi:hypothetical protein
LRKVGFKGSGAHFRRVSGDVINTIWIQGGGDGKKCAVNLGLHLAFLPVCWKEELPDLGTIKEIDCEFRCRLAPNDGTDHWWEYYGGLLNPSSKNARHLIKSYFEWGEPRFREYSSVESIANMISLAQLRGGEYINAFGGVTIPRAALAMARIQEHMGNSHRAAEFARACLETICKASGLRSELERLAGAA